MEPIIYAYDSQQFGTIIQDANPDKFFVVKWNINSENDVRPPEYFFFNQAEDIILYFRNTYNEEDGFKEFFLNPPDSNNTDNWRGLIIFDDEQNVVLVYFDAINVDFLQFYNPSAFQYIKQSLEAMTQKSI